jgi:hypothetical protein
MTKYNCHVCGEQFESHVKTAKYCSRECRLKKAREYTGRSVVDGVSLSTGTVGALSEMRVCADLLSKGYATFRALSPACFCDAVAIKGGKSYSLEIRTGYRSMTGKLAFPNKVHEGVDLFAVFERNSEEITYIDIESGEPVEI